MEQNGAKFSFIAPSSEELGIKQDFIKTPYFGQKLMESISANKDTVGKSISSEQNGAKFSFIAPSSEEL